ncbi:MAG: DUF4434 domain-containing protein [Bacteroidetes bacterium]|uniref:DUF4434 domain-containing protein n=1 Tax=Candidatus Cryptobacteroides avicola TaxID=2840757 RepID=A0A940DSN6_9BACT|nr:DUF4434 domain-containing protein [Candidatus Cryptobacteroides avicola]
MKHFKTICILFCAASCSGSIEENQVETYLSVVPPVEVTDRTDLDVRAGIVNKGHRERNCSVSIYMEHGGVQTKVCQETVAVEPGGSLCIRHILETEGLEGKHGISLKVISGRDTLLKTNPVSIIRSDIRSTRTAGGAFVGICHWSETEGKHWNDDIRKLTDEDWRSMVRSMHSLGLDIIVIQELFRNEEYVGRHATTAESYAGKAYYDSKLYSGRMEITASDPVEAILDEADKLGMHVFPGIGMFAWFDFTAESLEWHKMVTREVWEKYGHHDSFYGFYIPEESGGSLDNWEKTPEMRIQRKREIVAFFKEFKEFCGEFAPGKPIMLATNSFGIKDGMDTYPALLEHLDILCPFGFARMPEEDMTGKEAAMTLQKLCDQSGAHLWFDLEAFLFNDDASLYPRDIEGITGDLQMFDNFEKIIFYQYPGVFSDPKARIRVGEEKTETLFMEYSQYLHDTNSSGLYQPYL